MYNFSRDVCYISYDYYWYIKVYRRWISTVSGSVIPTCKRLQETPLNERRSCGLGVSIAYIFCVIPQDVYLAIDPSAPRKQPDVANSLVLLRYVNHANNFLLYSLTGAHFRCELVAVCRIWVQGVVVTMAVIHQIPSRVRNKFRRSVDNDLEME